MIDFLFISNGYGEDAIAAGIAKLLPPNQSVAGFPMVGEGKAYEGEGIPVIAGFPPLSGAGISFWKDVKTGWWRLTKAQWSALKAHRPQVNYAVAVGDIYPVIAAHYGLKKKFAFVGTAKSVTVQTYNIFERQLLKNADAIFVRDEPTARRLQKKDVNAQFVGNPIMDGVAKSKNPLPSFAGVTVTILPGSRQDAPENFSIQAEALCALQRRLEKPVRGLVVLPPTIQPAAFVTKIHSWDGLTAAGMVEFGNVTVQFLPDGLGDALRASRLVFGQAGTANEQAAGLGKPVIAFEVAGKRQLSWYRWRQKKLLGDALRIVEPDAEALAEEAIKILSDAELYRQMSDEGKARLGPPGAGPKIATSLTHLKN